jgi:hypothetical protein
MWLICSAYGILAYLSIVIKMDLMTEKVRWLVDVATRLKSNWMQNLFLDTLGKRTSKNVWEEWEDHVDIMKWKGVVTVTLMVAGMWFDYCFYH